MINLIPPVARKKVKREYWVRAVSVWMLLISIALVIVTLFNIPVYVLISGQLNAYASPYELATTEDGQFKQSEEEIKTANEFAKILNENTESVAFSDIIARLDELGGAGISVASVNLSRTKDSIDDITVTGQASTRVALANYKERIEAHEFFDTAELPLSNLAKDVDIPFSIKIKPNVNNDASQD